MKKWIRHLALAAFVAAGTAGVVSLSPETARGQGAKGTPTKPATPATKPGTAELVKPGDVKGKVVIVKDKQEKYRFQIQDENGKTLAMSTVGYATVADATKVIETVKALLNTKKPEEEK